MIDQRKPMPAPFCNWRPDEIAGHAMISDMETGALVYRDGTIDWLALPDFDSELCFASLLGDGQNGAWWMAPDGDVKRTTRRYVGETLILETCFETDTGTVTVTDFMPSGRRQAPDIVRIVEGKAGRVDMHSALALRFSDGRIHPLVHRQSEKHVVAIAGSNAVSFDSEVPIDAAPGHYASHFSVETGQSIAFVLTWFAACEEEPDPVDARLALAQTRQFWDDWAGQCQWQGAYREPVMRSLLALKGLVHARTGGMIAALTAGLPETPGGTRNWDYRFCWLRDATFALLAFLKSGYREEAQAWAHWLRRALAGEPIDIQPFYRIDGGRLATEREAPWLSGFGGAQPVRFGNGASGQVQLDVMGEAIDALFLASEDGIDGHDELILAMARLVEDSWQQTDAGIWESRGGPQHHVYSKAMCWVAFDRTASLCANRHDKDGEQHWRQLADHLREEVMLRGFNRKLNSFTKCYDDDRVDGALLRLVLVGFIAPNDPMMVGTVAAIERELMQDGMVWRYRADGSDGLTGEEGSFLACVGWLADVYAGQGRMEDAHATLQRLCDAANDLGLLSEQYMPGSGTALGNFPQALSHIALINAAYTLNEHGKSARVDAVERS